MKRGKRHDKERRRPLIGLLVTRACGSDLLDNIGLTVTSPPQSELARHSLAVEHDLAASGPTFAVFR